MATCAGSIPEGRGRRRAPGRADRRARPRRGARPRAHRRSAPRPSSSRGSRPGGGLLVAHHRPGAGRVLPPPRRAGPVNPPVTPGGPDDRRELSVACHARPAAPARPRRHRPLHPRPPPAHPARGRYPARRLRRRRPPGRRAPDRAVDRSRTPARERRYECWHRFRRPWVTIDADVIHTPSLAVPPVREATLVVTVHDIVFQRVPDVTTRRGVSFHRRALRDGTPLRRSRDRPVVVHTHGADPRGLQPRRRAHRGGSASIRRSIATTPRSTPWSRQPASSRPTC